MQRKAHLCDPRSLHMVWKLLRNLTHKCLKEPKEQVGVEGLVDRDVAGVTLDPEERRHPRPPPRLRRIGDGAEEERVAPDVLPPVKGGPTGLYSGN